MQAFHSGFIVFRNDTRKEKPVSTCARVKQLYPQHKEFNVRTFICLFVCLWHCYCCGTEGSQMLSRGAGISSPPFKTSEEQKLLGFAFRGRPKAEMSSRLQFCAAHGDGQLILCYQESEPKFRVPECLNPRATRRILGSSLSLNALPDFYN